MKRRILILLSLGLLFTSCASKDFAEPGVKSFSRQAVEKIFRGSYSDVWQATKEVLDEQKYPLATSQKESGVIITDWILGKSDRLYSGYGEARIPYNIRYKLSFRFKPSRKGVEVQIDNEEQYMSDAITAGTEFSGSLYQWIPTESSTQKEARLLGNIQNRLAQIQGQGR